MMKIYDNGKIRDMTLEEKADYEELEKITEISELESEVQE